MDYWGWGGGAKGMLAPLSNYWGDCPPLPTPMYLLGCDIIWNQHLFQFFILTVTVSIEAGPHSAIGRAPDSHSAIGRAPDS